ncbi:hypothetical protein MZH12_23340, partial [Escherichia coli]|nr:hypothetical protein [Escherichia coli]
YSPINKRQYGAPLTLTKNIGNIEDNPCQYCRHQTTAARLLNIRYKTATGFAHRTQREGK